MKNMHQRKYDTIKNYHYCPRKQFLKSLKKTASELHVASWISQQLYLAVHGSTWLYLDVPCYTWLQNGFQGLNLFVDWN